LATDTQVQIRKNADSSLSWPQRRYIRLMIRPGLCDVFVVSRLRQLLSTLRASLEKLYRQPNVGLKRKFTFSRSSLAHFYTKITSENLQKYLNENCSADFRSKIGKCQLTGKVLTKEGKYRISEDERKDLLRLEDWLVHINCIVADL
jgi:hypothetical protein